MHLSRLIISKEAALDGLEAGDKRHVYTPAIHLDSTYLKVKSDTKIQKGVSYLRVWQHSASYRAGW